MNKKINYALLGLGVIGTLTGTIVLPIGCLNKYTFVLKQNDKAFAEIHLGTGASNYFDEEIEFYDSSVSNISVDQINSSLSKQGKQMRNSIKYSSLVKDAKKNARRLRY